MQAYCKYCHGEGHSLVHEGWTGDSSYAKCAHCGGSGLAKEPAEWWQVWRWAAPELKHMGRDLFYLVLALLALFGVLFGVNR